MSDTIIFEGHKWSKLDLQRNVIALREKLADPEYNDMEVEQRRFCYAWIKKAEKALTESEGWKRTRALSS